MVALAELTTLRLGGPSRRLVEASTAPELVAEVRAADAAAEPLLLVGGGSNLVVADSGWPGVTLLVRTQGIDVRYHGDDVLVRVAAGVDWDSVVAMTAVEGWSGAEGLSGIPGLTGATPVQNVGAYGQDIAQTLTDVTVWDRSSARIAVLSASECGLGYRTSRFKTTDRYVVLEAGFRLRRSDSGVVRYAELARTLGVEPGRRAPVTSIRAAVLALRRGKGMVLDPADHDTWSAGSFFTNPILDADAVAAFQRRLGPDVPYPSWPDGAGRKLSAAWLIERSGFGKGYGGVHGDGSAKVSSKHTLALTNRGGARTEDLLALAREVRAGVRTRFGITLAVEPRLVGCSL